MTTYAAPICLGCTHLHRGDDGLPAAGGPLACDAFPAGIPVAILHLQTDHRKPAPGDHGVRFEAKDQRDAEYANILFSPIRWRKAREAVTGGSSSSTAQQQEE
jgi:hypothetical protein